MILAIGLLAIGAGLLFVGAEAAIRGAGSFARSAGIPLFALGALLFGIDVEGLGAAVVASARNQPSIAAGEVFGTVIFLFSAAFGAALLLAREPVASPPAEMVLAPGGALIMAALVSFDASIGRLEGLMLLVVYGAYVVYVVQEGRLARARAEEIEHEAAEGPKGRLPATVTAVVGLAVVYLGATFLVEGAVRILSRTGLSAGFVGAAIVATLASLDEVLLEVLPIRRGHQDLATGNLFGTLAAFCTGVIGIAALVRPLPLDGAARAALVFAAVLYTVVATTFLARGKAGRVLGAVVLTSYAGWLVLASRL